MKPSRPISDAIPSEPEIDRAIERLELLRIEQRDDQPGERSVGRGQPAAERDRPRARALEPVGLADQEIVLVRRGVLAERVEAADVEAERSLRGGGDDAVPVGETEMQRDLLAGGEGLRPCGEIEIGRVLPSQFAQQQQRIVGAADRARDVFLEDARVGLALRHGRVVGARLLLVGEIEQRGGGKDQQRHAQIGERLSERAHPGSKAAPRIASCPTDLRPRLKRDVLRTCSFRRQRARQFSNRLTNSAAACARGRHVTLRHAWRRTCRAEAAISSRAARSLRGAAPAAAARRISPAATAA